MLGRENRQNNFLDSWTYERMLPKEDPLLEIKEKIDFSFIEEETKDLYSYAMGRVSFPPVVVFKMLFLQYYANLSDRGVSKAVKRDVLFRYFVGLSIEDEVPDDTTLVKFRSRSGEERFRKLFDRIVKQAQDRGLLKERIKIVDATHITADIATQGLVNLLRQGRKMVVRKIEKATSKRPKELEERYITKEKIYKKPTNEEIEKEINLTKEFINQIEGKVSKGKTRQSEGDLYYFSILDCKSCTNKECLKKNMKRVRVYVSDAYKLRQCVDEEKKKEALLTRKRIEANLEKI